MLETIIVIFKELYCEAVPGSDGVTAVFKFLPGLDGS